MSEQVQVLFVSPSIVSAQYSLSELSTMRDLFTGQLANHLAIIMAPSRVSFCEILAFGWCYRISYDNLNIRISSKQKKQKIGRISRYRFRASCDRSLRGSVCSCRTRRLAQARASMFGRRQVDELACMRRMKCNLKYTKTYCVQVL